MVCGLRLSCTVCVLLQRRFATGPVLWLVRDCYYVRFAVCDWHVPFVFFCCTLVHSLLHCSMVTNIFSASIVIASLKMPILWPKSMLYSFKALHLKYNGTAPGSKQGYLSCVPARERESMEKAYSTESPAKTAKQTLDAMKGRWSELNNAEKTAASQEKNKTDRQAKANHPVTGAAFKKAESVRSQGRYACLLNHKGWSCRGEAHPITQGLRSPFLHCLYFSESSNFTVETRTNNCLLLMRLRGTLR